MRKILFDTDLLGDDLMALFSMARDSETEIVGVTAYGRRVSSLDRCRMTSVFLKEVGFRGVRLVPGAAHPLVQEPLPGCRYCDNVLSALIESWNEKDFGDNPIDTSLSAAEFIAGTIRNNPGEISLLCTGPLTNVALAVSLYPELPSLVRETVIMGGLYSVMGNSRALVEANMYNDPEAAEIFFKNFRNVMIVPLDCTLKVLMRTDELTNADTHSIRGIVSSCCQSHLDRGDDAVMPMHDVLAYLVMKDPSLVETRRCNVKIELRSAESRGAMCFDWNGKEQIFCTEVDTERAKQLYRRLTGGV